MLNFQSQNIKFYNSVNQLNLIPCSTTVQQVFNAMPDNSYFQGFSSDISDNINDNWQYLLTIEKASALVGVAKLIGVIDNKDHYIMRTQYNSGSGGLTGQWVLQSGDTYKTGDTIQIGTFAQVVRTQSQSSNAISIFLPLGKLSSSPSVKVTGTITVRDANGTQLNETSSFEADGTAKEGFIQFTPSIQYTNVPASYSIVSVLIVDLVIVFN